MDGKNLAVDPDTSLDWLDVSLTSNLSIAEVSTLLTTGSALDGFRYATRSEVVTLFQNLDLSVPLSVIDPGGVRYAAAAPALGQTTFVGPNSSLPNGANLVQGVLDVIPDTNPVGTSLVKFAYFEYDFAPTHLLSTLAPSGSSSRSNSVKKETVSHFLVRTSVQNGSVPEPASILVWGLLIAVGLKRRF